MIRSMRLPYSEMIWRGRLLNTEMNCYVLHSFVQRIRQKALQRVATEMFSRTVEAIRNEFIVIKVHLARWCLQCIAPAIYCRSEHENISVDRPRYTKTGE